MIKTFLETLNPISFEIQVPFLVVLFTIIWFFVCLFVETGSLQRPGCPESHYVDQTGFELAKIWLPLPPLCISHQIKLY